jgi:hypothetical protein
MAILLLALWFWIDREMAFGHDDAPKLMYDCLLAVTLLIANVKC